MESSSKTQPNDMQSSQDSFTHISTYKFMTSSFSKSQYSQVIFHDLCDIYPTDSDIKCTYMLTDDVKPQAGDKIAIFKVGWEYVSDYITFVRAQIPENADNSVLEVVFKAGSFSKKDDELYQLCYVTSGNVVAGASTPFSFQKPHESDFIAIEDPNDPGLVVFRSRVAQLQNDLERKNEENESLLMKYSLLEEKYNIIRTQFDKCEVELKTSNDNFSELLTKQEELISEKNDLEKSLQKSNDEICTLKQEKNCSEFSKEDLKNKYEKEQRHCEQLQKQIQKLESDNTLLDEKHGQYQESLKELFKKVEISENERTALCERVQKFQGEREILLAKLQAQEQKLLNECSKVENQISFEAFQEVQNELGKEKLKVESLVQEKERLESEVRCKSYSNDNATIENRALHFKILDLSESYNRIVAERNALKAEFEDIKLQSEVLKKENDELRRMLGGTVQGAEFLRYQDESQLRLAQLENLQLHHSKCEIRMKAAIDEITEKFTKEIRDLKKAADQPQPSRSGQQRNFTNFKDPASQIFEVFTDACSHVQNVFEGKRSPKSSPTPADNSEENDAEKLKDKMKILLNRKSEISENLVQEKHKCAELERTLEEIKEENAALKSRISVLEYELATLKGSRHTSMHKSDSPTPGVTILEPIDSLNRSITEFTKIVNEQKVLEQKIQEEKTAKSLLQSKVEDLLQEDAKISNKLQEVTERYHTLLKEKEELDRSSNVESLDVLRKVLDDSEKTINDMKVKLDEANEERERLNKTINELRAELVGKISIDGVSGYLTQISALQKELTSKAQECKFLAEFIQEDLKNNTSVTRNVFCPICRQEFQRGNREAFLQHFDGHMF